MDWWGRPRAGKRVSHFRGALILFVLDFIQMLSLFRFDHSRPICGSSRDSCKVARLSIYNVKQGTGTMGMVFRDGVHGSRGAGLVYEPRDSDTIFRGLSADDSLSHKTVYRLGREGS